MTALLTADELRGITAREQKATPGPWTISGAAKRVVSLSLGYFWSAAHIPFGTAPQQEPDAEFIAHARSDIPALLAHIKELTRQVEAYQAECDEVEQLAGKRLGYPWYKDDQKNFPGSTEADGVCIGEHVAATIAGELVARLDKAEAIIKELTRERDEGRDAIVAALDEKELYRGRWLESVTPEEAKRMRESAEAQVKELTKALEEARRDAIAYIAKVAEATALSAGVGASEVAGTLISVLHANHSIQESFWQHGFDVFIDGNLSFGPENGCLTFLSAKGEVLTPTELVRRKYGEGKIQ